MYVHVCMNIGFQVSMPFPEGKLVYDFCLSGDDGITGKPEEEEEDEKKHKKDHKVIETCNNVKHNFLPIIWNA